MRFRPRHTMSPDEAVQLAMKQNKFSENVQTSFLITLVNNGLPLILFVAVAAAVIYTRSLYTAGYMLACFAACISVAYTVWYFVSYLFVYVILYIQKIVMNIFGRSPKTKEAGKKL